MDRSANSLILPRPTPKLGRGSLWAVLLLLLVCGGASCGRFGQGLGTPLPTALPPHPSLEQVLDVLNRNSAGVQTLQSSNASISLAGYPSIRAHLAYQRENMFRLTGDAPLVGREVDLGSNPDVFWFWVKENQPPAMYYARHDQFALSNAKQMLPVDPSWLIKALGVVQFDTSEQHRGPFPSRGGLLEIRSSQPGVPNATSRVTLVDETKGIIVEQHAYDARGALLASAKLSNHVRTPSGVVLPHKVEVLLPAGGNMKLTISMQDIGVNVALNNPEQLFALPRYDGYPLVDLADPNLQHPADMNAPAGQLTSGAFPANPPATFGQPPAFQPPTGQTYVPASPYSPQQAPYLPPNSYSPPSEFGQPVLSPRQ
jgi:hypothetical protein